MKESFTTGAGRTLSYTRTGTGPLLVCHAGGPGFSAATLGDLGGLGDRFELVVLDPRGTGGSTPPADGGYRQEDYIADREELRLHLGLAASCCRARGTSSGSTSLIVSGRR